MYTQVVFILFFFNKNNNSNKNIKLYYFLDVDFRQEILNKYTTKARGQGWGNCYKNDMLTKRKR